MTEVTSFVIKRSEWLRGEGAIESALLRPRDGKRCCVGIYARACGVGDNAIANFFWPGDRDCESNMCGWVLPGSHWLHQVDGLVTANDSIYLDESEREHHIARIFADHGITVTFED